MTYGFCGHDPDDNPTPTLREWKGNSLDDRVNLIWRQVSVSLRDPFTRDLAGRIIRSCPARDDKCEIEQVYHAVKNRLRYTADPRNIDFFQTLRRSWENRIADCDDYTIAYCSLLAHIGFRVGCECVGSGSNPTHVYAVVEIPKSGKKPVEAFALDGTVEQATPGWRPPKQYRRFSKQFWFRDPAED